MRPSDIIQHFEGMTRRRIVLVCRVDLPSQRKQLAQQEKLLRAAAKRQNCKVLKVFKHIGPGWDPTWLKPAAQYAKERGAILLTYSTDTVIQRPPACCDKHRPCRQVSTKRNYP